MQFRPSTIKERREYYKKEFSIAKVKNWFKANKHPLPQLCALDPGTESGIVLKKKYKNMMFYLPFNELKQKIRKYIPEDVYYVRNTYKNPKKILKTLKPHSFLKQELVFDVDADNIKCRHKGEVCNKCIRKALSCALKIKKKLKQLGFKKTALIYSGRGFHVHVFDEKAYNLTKKERRILTNKFLKYPIDPWVSKGFIDLIRMPCSLNGLVSRKVIPIKNKLNIKKTIPRFLKN